MRSSHIFLGGVALATLGLLVVTPASAQEEPPMESDMPAETPGEMSGDMPDAMPGDTPIDQVDDGPAGSTPVMLTPEQQAEYDGWAPDQKYAYDVWPQETQAYYWSLGTEEQALFWRLSDEDKIALTAMTGPEREAAWEVIKSNAAAAEGPA